MNSVDGKYILALKDELHEVARIDCILCRQVQFVLRAFEKNKLQLLEFEADIETMVDLLLEKSVVELKSYQQGWIGLFQKIMSCFTNVMRMVFTNTGDYGYKVSMAFFKDRKYILQDSSIKTYLVQKIGWANLSESIFSLDCLKMTDLEFIESMKSTLGNQGVGLEVLCAKAISDTRIEREFRALDRVDFTSIRCVFENAHSVVHRFIKELPKDIQKSVRDEFVNDSFPALKWEEESLNQGEIEVTGAFCLNSPDTTPLCTRSCSKEDVGMYDLYVRAFADD